MSNPTMIRIICPNLKCRAVLSTPPKARGQSVRCSMCGTRVRVPDAPKPKAPADAAAGGK